MSRTSAAARRIMAQEAAAADPVHTTPNGMPLDPNAMMAQFAMFQQFMAMQASMGQAPVAPPVPPTIDPVTGQAWVTRETAPLTPTQLEVGRGVPTSHRITPSLVVQVDETEFPAYRPNGEAFPCPPAIRSQFMRHMAKEYTVILRHDATGEEIELGAVEPRKFKEGNHGLGGQADAWVSDAYGNEYRVKGYLNLSLGKDYRSNRAANGTGQFAGQLPPKKAAGK